MFRLIILIASAVLSHTFGGFDSWGRDWPNVPFQQPEELHSSGGELNITMEVTTARFTEGPWSWNHRAYDGLPVGRTWRVKPGDVLRVTLVNRLGTEEPTRVGKFLWHLQPDTHGGYWTGDWMHDFDLFAVPNHTNIHLHGMRVDPKCHHDNIMLDVLPQTNMTYEFEIPKDHPPGTNWYHPHVHRSGALHVASGMMGALIVDDDNVVKNGDGTIPLMDEFTLVLHEVDHSHFRFFGREFNGIRNPLYYFSIDQFSWASGDRLPLDKRPDFQKYPGFKHCGGNQIWPNTSIFNIPQRFEAFDCQYLLVNGRFRPTMPMKVGVWQRWRVVQSSHDSAIRVQFNESCEVLVLARDGYYYDTFKNITSTPVVVSAGSRADFAIRCHSQGLFDVKLLTGGVHTANMWKDLTIPRELYEPVVYPQVLLVLNVSAPPARLASKATFLSTPRGGAAALGIRVPSKKLGSLMDVQVDRKFHILYNLTGFGVEKPVPRLIGQFLNGGQFMMNGKSYTNRTEHCMVKGEVEEWTVESGISRLDRWIHSFHVHQNWYQIISQDLGIPGQLLVEDLTPGEWRDTVQIPSRGSVTFRLRFDFIGVLPYHCHVANHQDTGMMQLLQVVEKAEECPEGTLSPKLHPYFI